MHHGCQFGWRRFRFTWHQVSVLISRGGRAEPRPWHQTFCRDTSQRLHSRSVEALRRNGGPTPLRDGRRESSWPEKNFRQQQSKELHRHVLPQRRLQSEVPTPSTNHPDGTEVGGEVSQCQHLDPYRRSRREAETGPDQPDNPEDGREDTGPSAQRHVPIIQKIQKIAETPQVV